MRRASRVVTEAVDGVQRGRMDKRVMCSFSSTFEGDLKDERKAWIRDEIEVKASEAFFPFLFLRITNFARRNIQKLK